MTDGPGSIWLMLNRPRGQVDVNQPKCLRPQGHCSARQSDYRPIWRHLACYAGQSFRVLTASATIGNEPVLSERHFCNNNKKKVLEAGVLSREVLKGRKYNLSIKTIIWVATATYTMIFDRRSLIRVVAQNRFFCTPMFVCVC